MIDSFTRDLRYALRGLRKAPVFTLAVVATLALGIGANTAIFSVVHATLLRDLPFADPDRLVMVWEDASKVGYPRDTPSPANYIDWRDQNGVFESMAAMASVGFNLTGSGEPERIEGARVSATLFPLLGVQPLLGRVFAPDEDRPGANQVVVISHGLWQRRFGSDPAIVGSPLALNGASVTVVGVMAPSFRFPAVEDEIWIPMAFSADEAGRRGSHFLKVVARLKPGVTLAQAQTEMTGIAHRLEELYPQSNTNVGAVVVPLHEQLVGNLRPALLVLMGAVGFVLLIACANVANLLLARTAARQKEISIRVALGAERRQLVRQFLTESLVLAALGGCAGLLLSQWGIGLMKTFLPDALAQVKDVTLGAAVMVFAMAVSVITGLMFGLAPAVQASRQLSDGLKEGTRGSSSGRMARRVRGALVASEIAVSLVLLIGAGLLMNSFVRLRHVDPGFDPGRLLTMRIALSETTYRQAERRSAFYTELLSGLEALPGVESAAVTTNLPLTFTGNSIGISIEGRPDPPPGREIIVVTRVVSPDYFRTMGIPVTGGRPFTGADRDGSQPVAVISESMARLHWSGEDPVGRRIKSGPSASGNPYWTVVGVVKDVHQFDLGADPRPQIYLPYAQVGFFAPRDLVVRTSGEPLALAASVRRVVQDLDRDQPIAQVRTMEEIVSSSVGTQRFSTLMLGLFALVALALASVGIYGLISYSVSQRTREIGIRMALGAQRRDVLRLVIFEGMTLVLVGAGIGLLGALALTRLMQGLLYGVSAVDPVTFLATFLLLAAVALSACYLPARRAARGDQIAAIRCE
ncbi:MAG: ABC transporter permease [Candidatus Polarisedimenticolia bacterium]